MPSISSSQVSITDLFEGFLSVMLLDSLAFHRMRQGGDNRVEALRFTPVVDMPKVTTGFLRRADHAPSPAEVLLVEEIVRSFEERYGAWLS